MLIIFGQFFQKKKLEAQSTAVYAAIKGYSNKSCLIIYE